MSCLLFTVLKLTYTEKVLKQIDNNNNKPYNYSIKTNKR